MNAIRRALDGKSVVVTGAASGIGEATVERLVADGARVVAFDRSDAVKRDWLGHVVPFVGDAAAAVDVEAAVAAGRAEFGHLNGVVAAAGIARSGLVDEMPLEDWNEVLRVNLTSVFLLAKFMLPEFRKSGGGSFVAIASQVGMVGYPSNVAYCAAKAGVINLMRAMAIDHGAEGIRANALCPGPIDTPLTQQGFAQTGESYEVVIGRVLSGRMGSPADIAATASFLLSDDAAFVNGAAWLVDGGYTAQ